MTISSPLINVMLQSIRKASRALIRDFHEVANLQSSYGIGNFIRSAQSRSRNVICNELYNYKEDYGFLFEEDINTEVKNDYTWFITALDSQVNFMNALAYFALSISLIYKERVIAAIVDAPALKETFWVERGYGAFFEDAQSRHVRMRVKNRQILKNSCIDCYSIDSNIFNKLSSNSVNLRSMGSVSLSFAYLAAGRYDAVICSNINKYKAAMGMLFLKESNGKATIDNNNLLVASNMLLHEQIKNLP